MIIAVFADKKQWKEIKNLETEIKWVLVVSHKQIPAGAAAVFILKEFTAINYDTITQPIFINAVSVTLKELKAPQNVYRINGWSGFLQRPSWEIAGLINKDAESIFKALNKNMVVVPDEPGFIAARIIAMIINEAWYALEEKISSKKDIDIAMKLGTNYPYGPFEWGQIIGEKNILTLLQKLSAKNKKYLPSPLLKKLKS